MTQNSTETPIETCDKRNEKVNKCKRLLNLLLFPIENITLRSISSLII